MKREMILPVLLSFGISLALGPVLIPFLRKVKAGQKERQNGQWPDSHVHRHFR